MRYASMFKMPNISLRFFNVYGPRLDVLSQYSAVIGNFISQSKNKKPLTIVGMVNRLEILYMLMI